MKIKLNKKTIETLKQWCLSHNKDVNSVLDNAILDFLTQEIQKEKKAYKSSFQKSQQDLEILKIAEEGMVDYNEQLERY